MRLSPLWPVRGISHLTGLSSDFVFLKGCCSTTDSEHPRESADGHSVSLPIIPSSVVDSDMT